MADRPIDEARTDLRTPEARLLAKRRLGSFYLNDVQALIVERNRLREALERIREHAIERDRYIPMTGTIRACDEALNLSRPEGEPDGR